MDSYLSLTESSSMTIVNKSRFLGFIFKVKSEDEIAQKLKNLRKQYGDATHICYAYSLIDVSAQKFSDDGEPKGTAGAPILDVIKGGGYYDVLAVVIRYFGGIKLGTGGLSRAYGECIKEAVSKAKVIEFKQAKIFDIKLDYTEYNNICDKLAKQNVKILNSEFKDSIILRVAAADEESLITLLNNICKGEAEISYIETRYEDFNI